MLYISLSLDIGLDIYVIIYFIYQVYFSFVGDEFIYHTYHLLKFLKFHYYAFISFNQKAIFMGSLMQWLYLERMKVYYPIKILDTTFSTHMHTNGPVNLTFMETFVNTTLKFSGHTL